MALVVGLLVYQRSGSNGEDAHELDVPLALSADTSSTDGLPLQRAFSERSVLVGNATRSVKQLRASSSEPPNARGAAATAVHRLRASGSFDAVAAYSVGAPRAHGLRGDLPAGIGADVGYHALRLGSTGAPPPLSQARPSGARWCGGPRAGVRHRAGADGGGCLAVLGAVVPKIKDDYAPMKMAKKIFSKKRQQHGLAARGTKRH